MDFKHKAAVELIEKGPILDIGCGGGLFLQYLKNRGIEGCGLDISDKAIELAKNRGIDCQIFDVSEKLPFEDNAFEGVTLIDVLEHLFMPEEILKEAHRVAKKYLIFSAPNFVSLAARLQVLFGRVPENNTMRKAHILWATRKVLHQLLADAGFEVEKEIDDFFYADKLILGRIFKFLAKLRPEIFALSFIIKAKKV
ncbi:MAG: hypothetical protein Athens071412_229 [Parcubacteria group bacterium Athens0714_12]|nr:MAG: hypothetical protein Athens071412_229 [Parcubacteria group bacterium Athens0714_12]